VEKLFSQNGEIKVLSHFLLGYNIVQAYKIMNNFSLKIYIKKRGIPVLMENNIVTGFCRIF